MSDSNPIFLQYDFSNASYTNGILNDLGPNNINAKLVNNPLLDQAVINGVTSLKSTYFNASQSQYIQLPEFTTSANGMTFSFGLEVIIIQHGHEYLILETVLVVIIL